MTDPNLLPLARRPLTPPPVEVLKTEEEEYLTPREEREAEEAAEAWDYGNPLDD